MKKSILGFSLLIIVTAASTGCNKVIDKLFNGIDVKVPDIVIPVPTIPIVPPNEMTLGTVTMNFNLDSLIRANTANAFNVNDVNSVKVKQYVITLPEGDQNNNLSNFETGRVELFSNSNSTKMNVASFTFPDVATNTTTVQATNSPELITYLKGSQLSYTMYGKARKITTKPLTIVVSVTVEVK